MRIEHCTFTFYVRCENEIHDLKNSLAALQGRVQKTALRKPQRKNIEQSQIRGMTPVPDDRAHLSKRSQNSRGGKNSQFFR
jgi:hypothetical protein